MSPSEKEENTKKTGAPPEPLCLFCFPEDTSFTVRKTYVNTLTRDIGKREERSISQKPEEKGREDFWLKRRTEARIRRRRMREPIRNLRSYLLTSVKNEKVAPKADLPSLFEVLETVKDAWPSPSSRKASFHRNEDQTKRQPQTTTSTQPEMKDEKMNLHFPSQLLNRRLSMPEELMRKFSVKDKTSEESETNKTAVEISSSSSSTLETARMKETVRTEENPKPQEDKSHKPTKSDAYQQTTDSDEEKPKKTEKPKRVHQNDYYKQGQRIIKVKAVEKGTCTCPREHQSSTTASAKEETDESGTSESIPSSSPTQLPKRESSSGNLSSESDNMRCTCAELSSKETSTDLYHSGKSTLSQTVSDKSISTQDSTVSINSVSTRGSTVSDNSNSTTPEIERTSAKETTTTSPDYSPRTPRNRKNRRRDKNSHHKTCPKHSRNFLTVNYNRQCPVHSETATKQSKPTTNAATNTDQQEPSTTQTEQKEQTQSSKPEQPEVHYKWAKLSQEELYMMQQLRHRKFIESQRNLSTSLPTTSNPPSTTTFGTSYQQTEQLEQPIMIPRYSALPRTLSMLVNTSSQDSHNSDSDSLVDSLEDQPITHVHKLYFDTKKESKPVRGDASILQENKQRQRQPKGRAFFVSIKEPFGEDSMLENIEKIPQPPDKIKNQIFERHLTLCKRHKLRHKQDDQKPKNEGKKRKPKPEDNEKPTKPKKNSEEIKKPDRKGVTEKTKRNEDQNQKTEQPRRKKDVKDPKGRFSSKIPVLVSSRSGSSSPERDPEKPGRPKIRVKRPKEERENPPNQREVETTQILEITHSGTELSLQKPQAVIHPSSQIPFEVKPQPQLTMPPLVSTLKIPPIRQSWNKQLLVTQARRSPIGKFRQRFEVIPEEKSSSLSSAEEKNHRETHHPKCNDASTSPLPPDAIQFHSYNVNEVPNLIVAKITNKQLETLPYVKGNDEQKIILFSSKSQNSNSTKGRDALIAMNREDFNRLAKGWMNFYKLNENPENSENEEKTKDDKPQTNKQNNGEISDKPKTETQQQKKETTCLVQPKPKQDEPELHDNIRLDCSNTILREVKSIPPNDLKKQNSLPELKLPSQKTCEVHKSTSFGSFPKMCKRLEDDDTDSDSTDYMEPPSPRVPPLTIDDIPSDATLSSSDSELTSKPQPNSQSFKYLQFKKRTTVSKGLKKGGSETSRFGKKKNSGWSVTVAGTVELSRSAPDLEMRLSFPAKGGPPVVSQSDSGFAEDSNYSKMSESLQDLDSYMTRQELPLSSRNLKQKWMVTVKNPKKGDKQNLNKQFPNNSNPHLPDLETPQSRNSKKVLKDIQLDEKVKRLVERKMRSIWPKVQKVIKKEFLTESGRLIIEAEDDDGSCLSVRGSAVSLERKQKPPTMTERDVTRRLTSRTNDHLPGEERLE